MKIKSLGHGMLFLAVAFLGGVVGSWIGQPDTPEAGVVQTTGGRVVGTFGVGGVMTAQGQLWQYRPDKKAWVSLDESFALEGQGTSVNPLPVPAHQIKMMETFGFLVTRDDQCWLYNIDQHRWEEIGGPPS